MKFKQVLDRFRIMLTFMPWHARLYFAIVQVRWSRKTLYWEMTDAFTCKTFWSSRFRKVVLICVDFRNKLESIEAWLGHVALSSPPQQKIAVKKVHYVSKGLEAYPGIALYQLAKSAVFTAYVQPIRLQAVSEISELYEDRNITAVGFKNDILYSYQMRVIGLSEFREKKIERLTSVNYPNCQTYPVNTINGGGFFFNDYDGQPTLVSLYWGTRGGWKISTRVGMFYSWIHQITGLESRPWKLLQPLSLSGFK